jgi:16S rRNA (adenine1518-N6/adenine1519-N6)-dimethyltransferase
VRRKLGQHFLTDKRIIHRILSTANITSQDRVLEIGPGNGVLTFLLARQAKQLIAIEYDPELADHLQQAFAGQHHIRILRADARYTDYAGLLSSSGGQEPKVKIVANLPYYAAVPILLSILGNAYLFKECTLMFQKEVAERITASPGNKSYGPLALTVRYYAEPEFCFSIPPQAFRPRPSVESAVIKLHFLDHPRIKVRDQESFFHLIKCSFRSRRKTMKNSLAKHCDNQFPRYLLNIAYERLHLPQNIRGEELSIEDFANLSNFLVSVQRSHNVYCS